MPDSQDTPRRAGLAAAFVNIGKDALDRADVDGANDDLVYIATRTIDDVANQVIVPVE
jgi:hypothetical protein